MTYVVEAVTPHPEGWAAALLALDKERVPACVLCGTTDHVRDPRWEGLLALPGGYGIARCLRCDLRWLDPRPSAAGYAALYSDENYFGGAGASPVPYDQVVAQRRDYFRRRVLRIERAAAAGAPLAILDYGAASGDFVQLARQRGHRCDGVELSADARDQARARHGIELMSEAEGAAIADARYDVVHMNHVLEHMADPLAHLRWCGRILRPGGLLVAEVPQQFDNDLDRLRRWLGRGGRQARFDAYSLHHTYFFSPASLHALAGAAGFAPLRLLTFNGDKTPWWPPSLRNWVLRAGLGLADRLHRGGNILELYARNARPSGRP